MVIVIEMMFRSSQCNRLVQLLSIEGHVSLAIEQNSLLIQDRLASRKYFCALVSLKDDYGSSTLAVAKSSAPLILFLLILYMIEKLSIGNLFILRVFARNLLEL